MTIRTTKGKSISAVFFNQKKRLEWVGKLYKNTRKSLDKLGDIVTLAPSSLDSNRRGITLNYDGSAASLRRIERVLEVNFVDGEAMVKFSRITLPVKLVVVKVERKAA